MKINNNIFSNTVFLCAEEEKICKHFQLISYTISSLLMRLFLLVLPITFLTLKIDYLNTRNSKLVCDLQIYTSFHFIRGWNAIIVFNRYLSTLSTIKATNTMSFTIDSADAKVIVDKFVACFRYTIVKENISVCGRN